MERFTNGINLGGWLSQYGDKGPEHFSTFITQADIAQIASWGLDHVRLPVDYPVIEADDAPGVPLERGYGYIDACLEWCAKHGLAVVLDIHEAPGFTFTNNLEKSTAHRNVLFDSAEVQDRFVALWEMIAERYKDAPVPVIFELLNEVTLPTNEKWNPLAERLHAAIRSITPDVPVMIGGTHNNAVRGLDGLVVLDDPATVYTFHTYEPLLFTHQNAYWSFAPRTWAESPSYPGELPRLAEFLAEYPEFHGEYADVVGRHLDRDYLAEVLAPAVAFADATGKSLYCGEFGVADWIDPASRQRWLADFLGLLREHGIGSALWTYKAMDFGIVDEHGKVRDEDYLAILRG
jgi:endoglucanase